MTEISAGKILWLGQESCGNIVISISGGWYWLCCTAPLLSQGFFIARRPQRWASCIVTQDHKQILDSDFLPWPQNSWSITHLSSWVTRKLQAVLLRQLVSISWLKSTHSGDKRFYCSHFWKTQSTTPGVDPGILFSAHSKRADLDGLQRGRIEMDGREAGLLSYASWFDHGGFSLYSWLMTIYLQPRAFFWALHQDVHCLPTLPLWASISSEKNGNANAIFLTDCEG